MPALFGKHSNPSGRTPWAPQIKVRRILLFALKIKLKEKKDAIGEGSTIEPIPKKILCSCSNLV